MIAITIFLLSCKFNEASQPTFRDVNKLLYRPEDHEIDQYLIMEKKILELIDYDMWIDGDIYDKMARMEDIKGKKDNGRA